MNLSYTCLHSLPSKVTKQILCSEHFIYRLPRGRLDTDNSNMDLNEQKRGATILDLHKLTGQMSNFSAVLSQRVDSTENNDMYQGQVDIWRQEVGKVMGKVMYLSAELDDIVHLWREHIKTMEGTGRF